MGNYEEIKNFIIYVVFFIYLFDVIGMWIDKVFFKCYILFICLGLLSDIFFESINIGLIEYVSFLEVFVIFRILVSIIEIE